MILRLARLTTLLAFCAYPILLHIFILKNEVSATHLLLVFTPLLVVVSWFVFSSIPKKGWPFGGVILALLIYYVISNENGRIGLLAINGLVHASINLFMLWFFGRTLLHGQYPLISQIARYINGELELAIAIYTRRVTILWCVFFALQVFVSLSLYLFSTVAAWSFFINVLDIPLVLSMFVGEYAYRTVRYPNHPHTSIMKVIEVYNKNFAAPAKCNAKSEN